MAGDTVITVVGNLTSDPELRFTPSGAAVANFTIASTPRQFDRQTNEWKDGETLFLRCSIWRDAAEHVAESLSRGTRVIAQGRLVMRSYDKDGEKRTSTELQVDEIGPSLRSATAKVVKTERSGGQAGGNRNAGGGWGGQQQQQDDPWQTGGNAQQQGRQGSSQGSGWGRPSYDEPPF